MPIWETGLGQFFNRFFAEEPKPEFSDYAVSFNTLLRDPSRVSYPREDTERTALLQMMQTIERNTAQRIQWSAPLQAQLAKTDWTRADLQNWESAISRIISEETEKFTRLDDFRATFQNGQINIVSIAALKAAFRHEVLEGGRLDCGLSAFIEGSVHQKMANRFLAAHGEHTGFHRAGDHYFMSGRAAFGEYSGSHYFTYTPGGGIVEAQSDSRHTNPPSYSRIVNGISAAGSGGAVIITEHGSAYGPGWHDTDNFLDAARDARRGLKIQPSTLEH